MKSAFLKNIFRTVKSSYARYISIIVIVLLGAGVYAGLTAVSPNMEKGGDIIYDSGNVMDLRVISTYGLSEEDVKTIKKIKGVEGVMPSYTFDAIGDVADDFYTLRVNAIPNNRGEENKDYINQLKLVKGRWPEKEGEAVAVTRTTEESLLNIGNKVNIRTSGKDNMVNEIIDEKRYEIVGHVTTPYYLSYMYETTELGSGSIDQVIYIPETNFTLDVYTDLHLTVKGAKDLNAFSEEYGEKIDLISNELEKIGSIRSREKNREIIDMVEGELLKAKEEYKTGKKQSEDEFKKAETELLYGEDKIKSGEEELDLGEAEYNSGVGELKIQKEYFNKEVVNGQRQIDANRILASKQLESASKEIENGKKQLDDAYIELEAAKVEFAAGEEEYNKRKAEYDEAGRQIAEAERLLVESEKVIAQMQIEYNTKEMELKQLPTVEEINSEIAVLEAEIEYLEQFDPGNLELLGKRGKLLELRLKIFQVEGKKIELRILRGLLDGSYKQLEDSKVKLETQKIPYIEGGKELQKAKAILDNGRKELSLGELEWNKANALYESGLSEFNSQKQMAETQLNQAQEQLNTMAALGEKQIKDAEKKLSDGGVQLKKGKDELNKAKVDLENGKAEYNRKKIEVETQLKDVLKEIKKAEKQIAELEEPEWIVLDRETNEGFAMYKSDADRMANLASVFPIIFFLVAALVALTTMTRMVEEDRILIGTFKALGYSNFKIGLKYIGYAASASIIGSVIGVFIGFRVLPVVVWNAYSSMYDAGETSPGFYFGIAAISVLLLTFITCATTAISVRNSIRENPAQLMVGKAPKSGKRVFLEYIDPIWKRLSFTRKVTIRNLFLNKGRMLMAVIGIAGCTSLLVTGFGIREALTTLVKEQFNEIFIYDVLVGYTESTPSKELKSIIEDKNIFSDKILTSSSMVEVTKRGTDIDENVSIIVPEKPDEFKKYINLKNSKNGKEFEITKDSVVITEKLALNLDVKIGDEIEVNHMNSDDIYKLKITDIAVNYTLNYIYMGADVYGKIFEETPKYNQYITLRADGVGMKDVKKTLDGVEDVGSVIYTEDFTSNLGRSLESIDVIILVIIIIAGMLAFIVLYNLTNINIGERQREIATLKVLGFYRKETNSYIFRETLSLALMGCIVGLFMGLAVYKKVVETVEVDNMFFIRTVSARGYIFSAILTMVFAFFVNMTMKRKIRKIDMLESLKSNE